MSTATPTICPACSFEQDTDDASCVRCGVVFAKYESRERNALAPSPALGLAESFRTTPLDPAGVERTPWKLLAVGFAAAFLAHLLPPTSFLLSPLVTLLHEFGHAATAWLLGCPALPAFDFVYGGGVTYHQYFQLPLGIFIGGIWTWLGWTFRRNPRTLVLIGVAAGTWLLVISSEWRRELVISAMGHGGELILAGTLLWMALSGRGWRNAEIERPLGAFAAFFVQLKTMQFAWQLRNDPAFLAWYREGKGGAMMNDLEVVALDVQIWTGASPGIEGVAGWLLVFALVVPAVAITLHVFRKPVGRCVRSLLLLGS